MADLTNMIEATGTGIGGTAVLFGALWKPVVKHHDKTRAITAFLAGSPAAPGMAAVPPAGDRLVGVEVGLMGANKKLDTAGETLDAHTAALEALSLAVQSLVRDVRAVADQVTGVSHQVEVNDGGSMHDTIDVIAAEQTRVAIEKSSA